MPGSPAWRRPLPDRSSNTTPVAVHAPPSGARPAAADGRAVASVMATPPHTTSRRVIKRPCSPLPPPAEERAAKGDAGAGAERHKGPAGGFGNRFDAPAGTCPSNREEGACVV